MLTDEAEGVTASAAAVEQEEAMRLSRVWAWVGRVEEEGRYVRGCVALIIVPIWWCEREGLVRVLCAPFCGACLVGGEGREQAR